MVIDINMNEPPPRHHITLGHLVNFKLLSSLKEGLKLKYAKFIQESGGLMKGGPTLK